jgi:hypothetical protein
MRQSSWRILVLIVLCAYFALGGSFTCHASTDGDKFTSGGTTRP